LLLSLSLRKTIDQWLAGDTAYLDQKRLYKDALADYTVNSTAEKKKYNAEYGANLDKMKLERGVGQEALDDDYSARGLGYSGLYAKALGDYQNNYTTKEADLSRAKSAYLTDIDLDSTNFRKQQALELERAKAASTARRAAALGL
jgi:hypothetical protein